LDHKSEKNSQSVFMKNMFLKLWKLPNLNDHRIKTAVSTAVFLDVDMHTQVEGYKMLSNNCVSHFKYCYPFTL